SKESFRVSCDPSTEALIFRFPILDGYLHEKNAESDAEGTWLHWFLVNVL
ncbi:hypothetical protein ACH5RR_041092, partial [Cinchona calisaya]